MDVWATFPWSDSGRRNGLAHRHNGRIHRPPQAPLGLILRATHDAMLLSPPLILSRAQVDELFDKAWRALEDTAQALGKSPGAG